ncbi:MAG: M24 family metallopeptidase [Kosmotoga sp.]|nr:MAG: M24 family metallopeptidase [Kosmotoga sp.]
MKLEILEFLEGRDKVRNNELNPPKEDIFIKLLGKRLKAFLPKLMQKTDSDMWIIIGNENHPDPTMPTMLPESIDLGRLTIVVLCFHSERFERHIISRVFTESNDLFKASFEKGHIDEWDSLRKIVDRCDPKNIMLNYSDSITLADGLTYTNYKRLKKRLGKHSKKFKSSEPLALMWLNKRTQEELKIFTSIVKKTEEIIENVFKGNSISEMTTEELERDLKQKTDELGMTAWYSKVDFQRKGKKTLFNKGFIQPGDLIHCDFGIRHLGLSSDIQKLFYLPRTDEKDIPKSFKILLEQACQLQDIVSENLSKGFTGDEVLNNALTQMKKKGINGKVYTHPLGYYGHGSVPIIGRYNQQEKVPVEGNYLVYDNSCWAIELCVIGAVPEWDNQKVHILVEDSAILTNNKVCFISKRQKTINVLRS